MYKKFLDDLKDSMKKKDTERLSVLRMLLSSIKNEQINLHTDDVDDDLFFKVLSKNIKQLNESIEIYKKSGNEERALKEEKELNILQSFLPEQLSDSDLSDLVAKEISKIDNFSQKDIGKVMNSISDKYKNMVDSQRIYLEIKKFL
ncbi:GatB/YqeY domain-containing protein [Patescibacteria group bacterium]|nr:GatB/YqeY domain-containing protein [Patescibacteria group bacterium]